MLKRIMFKAGQTGLSREPEMFLYDFRKISKEDPMVGSQTWNAWSDEKIGGCSHCKWDISDEENGKAIFHGSLSLKSKDENITRTGYCATNTRVPWHLQNIESFDSIQMRIKSDHRKYIFNVDPQTYIRDDLFQGYIVVPKEKQGQWVTATLPFENFYLTGRGRPRETQRSFDQNVITGLGLSIQDQQEGDFHLEIEWIKVINSDLMPNLPTYLENS